MMALSKDIRLRIVAARKANEGSVRSLAKRFSVGVASVQRLFTLERKTGSVDPSPHVGGIPYKIPDSKFPELIALVEEKPDRTAEELRDEWQKRMNVELSRLAMVRALKRCKLTLKKTLQATERDSEKNLERRRTFEIELATVLPEHRVYLDEAGTNLGMTRKCARSVEGQRAFFKRPANYGRNISLVGAIRLKASAVLFPFDGPVDGDRFLSFLDNHLIPTLQNGDVVIMDNCRIHHNCSGERTFKCRWS